jgi:putative transposase
MGRSSTLLLAGAALRPDGTVPGTVRRELLDRVLIMGRRHVEVALTSYVVHYNEHRPHRSLGQAPPLGALPQPAPPTNQRIRRLDRLGGAIHEYTHVA